MNFRLGSKRYSNTAPKCIRDSLFLYDCCTIISLMHSIPFEGGEAAPVTLAHQYHMSAYDVVVIRCHTFPL